MSTSSIAHHQPGIPARDHHEDAHHDDHGPEKGWRRWVFATNHKDIGTMYLLFSLLMFFVGGTMAMVIRAELFEPGLQLVDPMFFNSMTSMHALIMIFGAVMPAFVGPRELDDPAAGRRAGHGAAAHEQLQLLDPAVRLHAAARHAAACQAARRPAAGRCIRRWCCRRATRSRC